MAEQSSSETKTASSWRTAPPFKGNNGELHFYYISVKNLNLLN